MKESKGRWRNKYTCGAGALARESRQSKRKPRVKSREIKVKSRGRGRPAPHVLEQVLHFFFSDYLYAQFFCLV
jgi:hypothetical protein